MTIRKKLIEVSLPLDAINKASAREKSIRHGHPSTLHLWWARRPLAACRAVLFAQLVDDPSAWPDRFGTDDARRAERDRLHRLIEQPVKWESSTDETILGQARWEIARSLAWARGEEPPPDEDGAAVLAASAGDNDREATSLGHRRDKWPEALAEMGAALAIVSHFRGGAVSGNPSRVLRLGLARMPGGRRLDGRHETLSSPGWKYGQASVYFRSVSTTRAVSSTLNGPEPNLSRCAVSTASVAASRPSGSIPLISAIIGEPWQNPRAGALGPLALPVNRTTSILADGNPAAFRSA